MEEQVEYEVLDEALRRCGASWDAAQTHGLLTGRLAVAGVPAAPDWLLQVLDGTEESSASRQECAQLLDALYQATFWRLSERMSEFAPLLPDDESDAHDRTMALAHWSEGFLHGLVSTEHDDALKKRLAAEPLEDIIRDMLQITRAFVDERSGEESNEVAYAEIVEYLRVAAQLAYEELADIRNANTQ